MPDTPNVTIIRGLYRALARRDLGGVAARLSPDVAWHTPASVPWGGDLIGIDAVRGYVTDLWGFFAGYRLEAARFAGSGDQVIVAGRHGPRASMPFMHVCRLRDELLVDWREQTDAGLLVRAIADELAASA